jgi:hypothetical protein
MAGPAAGAANTFPSRQDADAMAKRVQSGEFEQREFELCVAELLVTDVDSDTDEGDGCVEVQDSFVRPALATVLDSTTAQAYGRFLVIWIQEMLKLGAGSVRKVTSNGRDSGRSTRGKCPLFREHG